MRGSRLLALAIALVLAVGLAEAVLRVGFGLGDPPLARLDPETEYELAPSARYRRWGNGIEINAHGMRARDHAVLPAEGERRILLIGDSVVYGTNFLDQSETMAAALEARLSERAKFAECRLLALPMAASSWGPVNQLAFLDRMGTFGAEAAVIVLSAHDLYDTPLPESDILPYRLRAPWGAIGDAIEIFAERARRAGPGPDAAPPQARAQQSLDALERMVERLVGASVPPVLAYHPTMSERSGDEAPERGLFRRWADERGLRFLDLGRAIAATDGYRDDIHPDGLGAVRIAGALADILEARLPACGGSR